jgi:glycosyltransferase involved in cell wall biosynthesis
MHPQKRPLDLVALAQRVGDLEMIHFVLVGGGDLEDEVDEAIETAVGARIRRLAFSNNIPDLILASDVGCLVSDHEGLPVFMLECLQLGRPFLGTRVGDLGTVLDDTGAGLVIDEPGDLEALEAAVRRLADPRVRAELAGHARVAAPRFSVATCADAYARVFLGGS